MDTFETLRFSPQFFDSFANRRFSTADRAAILRALHRLDSDSRAKGLRLHPLKGELSGLWSASASDELRIHFRSRGDGVKDVLHVTRHYDD